MFRCSSADKVAELCCKMYLVNATKKFTNCLVSSLILICIFLIDAGIGDVAVVIEDPNGNTDTVQPHIDHSSEESYRVSYTPKQNGPHKVYVTFAGVQIPKSPFEVPITMRKCRYRS